MQRFEGSSFMWEDQDLVVVVPILCAIVFYLVYWFVVTSKKTKALFHNNEDSDKATINHFLFKKLYGLLSLGVAPAVICFAFLPGFNPKLCGLIPQPEEGLTTLLYVVGAAVVVVPVAYLSSKNPQHLSYYPEIRAKSWGKSTLFISLSGWTFYLLGYEFLFRGVLFLPIIEPLGLWVALVVNVAIYSAVHIPKGLGESVGAIFIGAFLCYITLITGSIWAAFLTHVVMAWSNNLFSLMSHPDMKYVK